MSADTLLRRIRPPAGSAGVNGGPFFGNGGSGRNGGNTGLLSISGTGGASVNGGIAAGSGGNRGRAGLLAPTGTGWRRW